MNCFNNNRPKLTSSDRTTDLNSRTIYKSNVRSFQQQSISGKCKNYNGKVGYYTNGFLRNTRSFKTKQQLQRGYSLCVDGAYSRKCNIQANLERSHQIGENLQRGLFSCKQSNVLTYQPVKLSMGRDSIYNQFLGSSLDSAIPCNPLSGFRVMESWPDSLEANEIGNPPWNNQFGSYPRQNWESSSGPAIAITDASGSAFGVPTYFPLTKTVIDPDNNLFGTDFCPDQLSTGEGPFKYLQFTRTRSFSIVQGQIFDPTGKGYTGTTKYIPPNSGPGTALPCGFPPTQDECGNPIRLPKKGDLAVAGLGSILDINSNVAQSQNFSEDYFINGWFIDAKDVATSFPPAIKAEFKVTGFTDGDALGLYETAFLLTKGKAATSSNTSVNRDIEEFTRNYRKLLLTQSWAFQWFSGVGLVDAVCCIDEPNKIFRVIVKTFWGDMWPPELLPAEESVDIQSTSAQGRKVIGRGGTFRGAKGSAKGTGIFVGGVHKSGNLSDLKAMAGNRASYPTSNLFTGILNNFKAIAGVSLVNKGPPGQRGQRSGTTATDVTQLYLDSANTVAQSFEAYTTWSAPQLNQEDLPTGVLPGSWYFGLPTAFKSPPAWPIPASINNCYLWILNLELFAGSSPAPNSVGGKNKWGGGIAFIDQEELASFYKGLMGAGFAPVSIMGYQNTGNLKWGSADDFKFQYGITGTTGPTSIGCTGGTGPSMARNAMLLGSDGFFDSTLRGHSGFAGNGNDAYGVYVLRYLEDRPYTVQQGSGQCGDRNLAFGNQSKQNYIVSYDKNGGSVNFAVNQKLYTNFKYSQS